MDESNYEVQLNQILLEEGIGKGKLPNLTKEKGVMESLMEWVQGLIKSLFPQIEARMAEVDWVFWIKACGIFFVCFLGLGLLWRMYWRRFRTWNKTNSSKKPIYPSEGKRDLEWVLRRACEDKDWAQAARIRWRLHLRLKKASESLTLREVLSSHVDWLPEDYRNPRDIFEVEALMFGGVAEALTYDRFDRALVHEESRRLHATQRL